MSNPRKLFALALALFLAASELVGRAPTAVLDTRIGLDIELLLIDDEGVRLLRSGEADLGAGGARYDTVQLGEKGETVLLTKLSYNPVDERTIQLELERSIRRGEREEQLPPERQALDVLDSWHTTVLEETGLGGRLELRVVPFVRERMNDEPIGDASFGMFFEDGPVLRHGERPEDDRVIFRGITVQGGASGLRLGIPDLGVVRLSHREFPGAVPCGWVRGHEARFSVSGQDFSAWSASEILPQDRSRPGKGWTLFCDLASDANLQAAFWGTFDNGPMNAASEIAEVRQFDLNWAMELNRAGRWDEALQSAERVLSSGTALTPLQRCEAEYDRIYGNTRLGRLDAAREILAGFDRSCASVVRGHWVKTEVDKLREELGLPGS